MIKIKDKIGLEIALSKLKAGSVSDKKIELEQYQSSASLVGLVLWKAFLNGDITGKTVADLGCGNGIFGIGALLLGAVKVVFVDVDSDAIDLCKENVESLELLGKAKFLNCDVSDFDFHVDTVIMNPPFGVKVRKADKIFLSKAFAFSNSIYSLHKIESAKFISAIASENGFEVEEVIPVNMKILKSYFFHKLNSKDVEIGIWVMKK